MICKSCGTEIADKALICYRCGTPTSAPARVPTPVQRQGAGRWVSAIALLVLVFLALFLGVAGDFPVPPVVSYSLSAAAALLLVWRLWRRRRR
jgi:hypothetical protein